MKKVFLLISILAFSALFLFLIPGETQAQVGCPAGLVPCARDCDSPDTPWDDTQSCTLCHFFVMFDSIVDFVMLTLVPIVAVLMLVIGGVMFFLATGNPGALSQAKSVITTVVLGLVIVYAAWIIVNMFLVIIGVNAWTGLSTGWFSIDCDVP